MSSIKNTYKPILKQEKINMSKYRKNILGSIPSRITTLQNVKEMSSPYLTFIKKYPYPPLPSTEYYPDPQEEEKWVEGFCFPQDKIKAKLFVKSIEYIDRSLFFKLILSAWNRFEKYIDNKRWIAYVSSDLNEFLPDKSPFWIFRILYSRMKNKPLKILINSV